jgi:probable rRNA maturation factor
MTEDRSKQMFEVINNQRKVSIEFVLFLSFAAEIQKNIPDSEGKTFTVVFISDRKMKELNNLFRGRNSTTDVLSFPYVAERFEANKTILGEIVISAEQAQKQADENGLTLEGEIKQLILHGLLHLCGYDHETDDGVMNARELELREELGI